MNADREGELENGGSGAGGVQMFVIVSRLRCAQPVIRTDCAMVRRIGGFTLEQFAANKGQVVSSCEGP